MTAQREEDEKAFQVPPDTLGLHVLYPSEHSTADLTADIVAVHGLGGDSYSTWTVDKTLWLRDLLPKSELFKNARVMTFGYDARAFIRPFQKSTTGRNFVFAEALVNDLLDKRTARGANRRPIIFVGHSLGGIVIKTALDYARRRESVYGSIPDCTKALVFFGTPHQGADAAIWATYLGKIGRGIGIKSTQVTEELQRWSDPLVELTTTFSEIAPNFQITTFFEKRSTHGVMVVHEGSARMGQRNERIRGLEADHISICKLTENNPNWQIVLSRFEAIAAEELTDRLDLDLPHTISSNLEGQSSQASLERRLRALQDRSGAPK